jgi:hypothetical protein
MDAFSPQALTFVSTLSALGLAAAGPLYARGAFRAAMRAASKLHGRPTSTVSPDRISPHHQTTSEKTSPSAAAFSASGAVHFVEDALSDLSAFSTTSSIPLAVGSSVVGLLSSAVLTLGALDRASKPSPYSSSSSPSSSGLFLPLVATAAPAAFFLGGLFGSAVFRVRVPGLDWLRRVSSLSGWARLVVPDQLRGAAKLIVDRVVEAQGGGGRAVGRTLGRLEALNASAWAAAPGVLGASLCGAAALALLAPQALLAALG